MPNSLTDLYKTSKRFDKLIMLMCINKIGMVVIY